MRRGIVLLPVVGLLVAVLVLSNLFHPPVDAQDRTEDRVAGLETRVAALETAVAGGALEPGGSTTASTHVLTGTFALVSQGEHSWPFKYDGGQCGYAYDSPPQKFRGFEVGSTVTVKNEADEVIAIGIIERSGEATIDSYFPGDMDVFGNFHFNPEREHDYSGTCILEFIIENVPNATFYLISVDDQVFPPVSYEELEAQDWTVAFTIQAT